MYAANENYGGISPTKQSIKNYLAMYFNCSDMELVEGFDTLRTRHICQGSNQIVLLNKFCIPVPTSRGMIAVETFFCQRCRKLIVNKESLEM